MAVQLILRITFCVRYFPGRFLSFRIMVTKYYHFFWVPIFPIKKDANVICKSCGLKRYDMLFDSGPLSNYKEVKMKFRHRSFTYIGIVIFALIFVLIIAAAAFQ